MNTFYKVKDELDPLLPEKWYCDTNNAPGVEPTHLEVWSPAGRVAIITAPHYFFSISKSWGFKRMYDIGHCGFGVNEFLLDIKEIIKEQGSGGKG